MTFSIQIIFYFLLPAYKIGIYIYHNPSIYYFISFRKLQHLASFDLHSRIFIAFFISLHLFNLAFSVNTLKLIISLFSGSNLRNLNNLNNPVL